ncbi:MAG TPA: hypothetical protein VK447_14365 [Myxococcaceae bacterium]|nr:hypothetical protein [Myxococcaceae bacterium]
MAKSKPPSSEKPSRSTSRRGTSELAARAERAAQRTEGTRPTESSMEVITEILDKSQLPRDEDDDTLTQDEDDTLTANDPRERLPPPEATPTLRDMPKLDATRTEEIPKPDAAKPPVDEDARQAELLLKSFLAAHVRSRDPEPEKKAEEPKPPEPKPAPTSSKPTVPAVERKLPVVTAQLPASMNARFLEATNARIAQTGTKVTAQPSAPANRNGAIYALNQAQLPGVFVVEHQRGAGQSEDDEDPALAAAVEEAIGQLFGVRGIHHIGPGQNDAGEAVVVVAAGPDFGEAALAQIPESVGAFKTVVTLPFDLLPLRRNR